VVNLIKELQSWNVNVVVEDPWADASEVFEEYGIRLQNIDDAGGLDSLVVAVGHREFRDLSLSAVRSWCRTPQPVLADLKWVFDKKEASSAGFTVFRL